MSLIQLFQKVTALKVGKQKLLYQNISNNNVLWNKLIRYAKLLEVLRNLILVYAGSILILFLFLNLSYHKPFPILLLLANFPSFMLLLLYFKYATQCLKLHKKFDAEIKKRRLNGLSLAIHVEKVALLKKTFQLLGFYSIRVLVLCYACWIVWAYFYFYPKPKEIRQMVSEAHKIEAKIKHHKKNADLRYQNDKVICDKIQLMHIHQNRAYKKHKKLQSKIWGKYSNLKRIEQKITQLRAHLTRENTQRGYLRANPEIVEELEDWAILKAELRGETVNFDEQVSDLSKILQELIVRYHKSLKKGQEAIYEEQKRLKLLNKYIERLKHWASKLEHYRGNQEAFYHQKKVEK